MLLDLFRELSDLNRLVVKVISFSYLGNLFQEVFFPLSYSLFLLLASPDFRKKPPPHYLNELGAFTNLMNFTEFQCKSP